MRFRMLLGRIALQDRFLIDPAASYLMSRKASEPNTNKGEVE
jgi:hypothetical protein